jgi:hypothetical protein
MARRWVERDHPRYGPGERGGQFRDKIGSGGWAAKVSRAVGARHRGKKFDPMAGLTQAAPDDTWRGLPSDSPAGFDPMRGVPLVEPEFGDDSWRGGTPSFDQLEDEPIHGAGAKRISAWDLAGHPEQYVDNEEFEVYDPDTGIWGTLRDVFTDDRNTVSYDDGEEQNRYVELDGDGFHFTADFGERISIRRKNSAKSSSPTPEVDDDAIRRALEAENNAEFGGEAELERGFAEAGRSLTNRQVAAALAPVKKRRR